MSRCPCGGGDYASCCEPLHLGQRDAVTAEQLMRSRYSAFALALENYLFRTWHPRTRPSDVEVGGTDWVELEIVDVVAGGPDDDEGIVEFIAWFRVGATRHPLRERSTFARRAGRWMYVEAVDA